MKAVLFSLFACVLSSSAAYFGLLTIPLATVYILAMVVTLFVSLQPHPTTTLDNQTLQKQLHHIQAACETNSQALSALLSKAV